MELTDKELVEAYRAGFGPALAPMSLMPKQVLDGLRAVASRAVEVTIDNVVPFVNEQIEVERVQHVTAAELMEALHA